MEPSTHYWLSRVAVKLHKLFINGVDLKQSQRWIFDWNSDLGTPENLRNVAAEDKALTTLTVVGAIKTDYTSNLYLDYRTRFPGTPVRWEASWGNMDKPDAALLEYGRVCFLEDFSYDTFVEFCKEQGINYKEDGILATLEITNQIPTVRAGNKTYTLKTLQNGSPLIVIEAAYDHADERFGFDELRQWTKKTFEAQKSFTVMFRKNEFGKGNILCPFADITPSTFMLKKQASLTPAQLSAIQKSSTD